MAKRNLVNWTNSMPLSASIFNQQDDYYIDRLRDCIAIRTNNYNYGLLPMIQSRDVENGIQISQHVSGHIEACLQYCNAITSSGLRIEYNSAETGNDLVKNYSVESDIKKNIRLWDVILAVNPLKRVASGEINPEETPPRHPDSEPSYDLYIMPHGEVNSAEIGSHYLTIGRIRKDAERFMVDADFIPPCTTMNSHPELNSYYVSFGNMFRSLENYNKTIINKINTRSDRSDLAASIAMVCREMLRYMASVHFNYVNKGLSYAPIEVLNHVSSLAHNIYVSFSFMPGASKDEILKYFYEWSDVTPGSFDELLSNTLEMRYSHTDIRSSMIQAKALLYTITELWQRLSTLEYIGQHKDNIVVSERSSDSVSGQSKSWSIVD